MMKIFIFIPNDVESNATLEGFVKKTDHEISFYALHNYFKPQFIGYTAPENGFKQVTSLDYFNVRFDENRKLHVSSIKVNGHIIDLTNPNYQIYCVQYNRITFEKSELFPCSAANKDRFQILAEAIRACKTSHSQHRQGFVYYVLTVVLKLLCACSRATLRAISPIEHILKYSSTGTHIVNWLHRLVSLGAISQNNLLNLRALNLLVSVVLDIGCGLTMVYYASLWQEVLNTKVLNVVETVVTNLRDLLEWLMGSPVGLKLNHSFNILLGKFFLYHITLWRAFLMAAGTPLTQVLRSLLWLGPLGLTFAAAVLADLIALATFHIYCIYVYAARFYRFQIMGLGSLWRLFLGRKYNPLRDRVDSCQYSHRQLFVGTLAFTMLLFLLPTTTMYYAVFATLRLCLLIVDGILLKLRNTLQYFPLLMAYLWIINAPTIASHVHVEVNSPIQQLTNIVPLVTTLKPLSLWKTVQYDIPVQVETSTKFSSVIQKIFAGHLL